MDHEQHGVLVGIYEKDEQILGDDLGVELVIPN
jgi:hypothetical protein